MKCTDPNALLLDEVRKLDARWREAFDFAMMSGNKLVIAACAGDLRRVLAGKRVDELEPVVTAEDIKLQAKAKAAAGPEVLAALGIKDDSKGQ